LRYISKNDACCCSLFHYGKDKLAMGKKLIWKLVKWKKKKPYGTKLALTDVRTVVHSWQILVSYGFTQHPPVFFTQSFVCRPVGTKEHN